MRNNFLGGALLVVGFLIVVAVFSSAFVIQEGKQAVITQFGKPVRVVKDSGLHFKTPFVHDLREFDRRILNWDGYPNQIPTKDKKYIKVDTTARWKIVDPLKFIQTVQNESGARSRLDAILDGITRDVISSENLVEAVRNSNNILEDIKERDKDEISGEINAIETGREKLSEKIVSRARTELEPLGVELIDVQLKRITYEESVQQKVYSRMISERQRIAEKIRSYGKGEQAKIEGKTDRDLKKIESEAYRKVQNIKGKAEAEATAIYARTLGKDPRFYKFIRSLEAYEKAIPSESKFLLSTESKFWEVLHQ